MKIQGSFLMGPAVSLLVLTTLTSFSNAANILVMLPMPFRSHTMNFMPIFKGLAAKGHNVTIVSPYPQKTPVPNLHDIVVPNKLDEIMGTMPSSSLLDMDNMFFQLIGLWMMGEGMIRKGLEMEQVQRIIKDTDSKFDLIMAESWFIQFPFVAFAHKFKAPVVSLMPASLFPTAAQLTGNHLPLSYAPLAMFAVSDHMNFIERLRNAFFYYFNVAAGELYFLPQQDAIMREYFKYPGSENLPYLVDMLRNVSLTLMDTHFAIGYPLPLHKNVVEFGGINAKVPEKLPADLQKIMDSEKNGVVYVSFGSYFNVTMLKQYMQDAVINAIGQLKYKVLLKLDDETILVKYPPFKNVVVKKWFPQASILAHPNCKLFVTHGGIHGLMEGLYNAVPMVAFPIMADQKFNAKFIETTGIGKVVDKYGVTSDILLNAINEVMKIPSYREKVNERSAIFKDNPISTLDNVIYWIEYVIRHKGAPHLRPAVLDLYWYQYLMLDVIAFYLLVVSVVVYALCKIIKLFMKCIAWLCCSKKSKTSSKKSKRE